MSRFVNPLSSSLTSCITNCTQLQVEEGIDAVIVDSVLAIRKGLTAAEEKHIEKVTGNGASKTNGRAAHQELEQVVEDVNNSSSYSHNGNTAPIKAAAVLSS